jgi:hypothetical protein
MGTNSGRYAMSELSVYEGESFKQVERVANHMLKGHSEFKTARDLGMKVVEVRALWDQYKDLLEHDTFARDAARDYLNLMVVQYDELIAGLHQNMADLDTLEYDVQTSNQRVATAKAIADMQAKRVDAMQKAGLLDQGDLGDELAEREKQEAALIDILRNDLCEECQAKVAHKLQKITGQVEAVQIHEDIVDADVHEHE